MHMYNAIAFVSSIVVTYNSKFTNLTCERTSAITGNS